MEQQICALFSCADNLHGLKKFLTLQQRGQLSVLNDQINALVQPLYESTHTSPYYHWRKQNIKQWLSTQVELLPAILPLLSQMRQLETSAVSVDRFFRYIKSFQEPPQRCAVFDEIPWILFHNMRLASDSEDADLHNDIYKVTLDFHPERYWKSNDQGMSEGIYYVNASDEASLRFGIPAGQKMRLVVQND